MDALAVSEFDAVSLKGRVVTVRAPKSIFNEEVVLNAMYWLLGDHAAFVGESETDFLIHVLLAPLGPLTAPRPGAVEVARIVSQALVDSKLRDVVASKTAPIRDMIVARALVSIGTLDAPPGDHLDPVASGLDYSAT